MYNARCEQKKANKSRQNQIQCFYFNGKDNKIVERFFFKNKKKKNWGAKSFKIMFDIYCCCFGI